MRTVVNRGSRVAYLHAGYGRVLGRLKDHVETEWSWPSGEGGFVLLLSPEMTNERAILSPLSHRQAEAPVLAACGYAAHAGLRSGLSTEEWKAGAERLSRRSAMSEARDTFMYRPHEILGLALGISFYKQQQLRTWLASAVERLRPAYEHEPSWKRILLAAAAWSLGLPARLSHPDPDDIIGNAYHLVLSDVSGAALDDRDKRQMEENLLRLAAIEDIALAGAAQAAAIHVALSRVVEEVVASVVEDFIDPQFQEQRHERQREVDSLRRSVFHFERRTRLWGRRYEIGLRMIFLPIALAAMSLPLLAAYRWLDEKEPFDGYGLAATIALVGAMLLIGVYFFLRDWENSPANTLPRRFGEWNASRIRKRWLDRDG